MERRRATTVLAQSATTTTTSTETEKSLQSSLQDEEECYLALQLLLRKLRESQPSYLDEDVVHPHAELNLHPPRHESFNVHPHPDPLTLGAPLREGSPQAPSSSSSSSTSLNIMEMVNHFEAKQLWRTRRCVSEVIQIVSKAISLIFSTSGGGVAAAAATDSEGRSGGRGATTGNSPSSSSSSGDAPTGGAVHQVGSGSSGVSPQLALLGISEKASPPSIISSYSNKFISSSSSASLSAMQRRSLQVLDEGIQCLLVYANDSEPLRSVLQSDRMFILMLCRVCSEARLLHMQHLSLSGDASQTQSLSLSSPSPMAIHRNVQEMEWLWECLRERNVVHSVAQSLVDVYALEFLLDAALPPAVCSARYDGLASLTWEKKAMLTSEMISSRSFVASVVKRGSTGDILRLAIMGLFSPPKTRSKLFERIASEGLMTQLGAVMEASTDFLEDAAVYGNTSSPSLINAAFQQINEAVDILLCLTSTTLSSNGDTGTVDGGSDSKGSSDGRGRSSSRSSTIQAKVSTWSLHIQALSQVCTSICRLVNKIPCGALHPSTSTHRRHQGGNRHDDITAVLHLNSSLVEKMNELLAQLLNGSVETLKLVISILDRMFDQVACKAVCHLLPCILRIVSNERIVAAAAAATSCGGDASLLSEELDVITEWFSTTVGCDIVPHVFFTRKPWSLGRILSSLSWNGALPSFETLALSRHIRRDELRRVHPFLTFAKRLVKETSWRSGVTTLLKKVVLICKSVIMQEGNRPHVRRSLYYGLATECLEVLGPAIAEPQDEGFLQTTLGRLKRARSGELAPSSPPPAASGRQRSVEMISPTPFLPTPAPAPPLRFAAADDDSPIVETPPSVLFTTDGGITDDDDALSPAASTATTLRAAAIGAAGSSRLLKSEFERAQSPQGRRDLSPSPVSTTTTNKRRR